MGNRTSYRQGTFCWADLGTTDPDGAKAFYGELLGWEPQDIPTPAGVPYTVLRRDGRAAAALSAQQPDERARGIPPHWKSYIAVDDVDATCERVDESGGIVIDEPFDVMDAGRMAVVQDPTGAVVCLWQAKGSIGAEVVNEPGAMVWNELASSNPAQARAFFADLLGWTYEDARDGYVVIRNDGNANGGIRRQSEEEAGIPAHWLVYFAVEDLDAAVATVGERGGTVHVAPMSFDEWRIAVVGDPQGAVFALYAGRLDP